MRGLQPRGRCNGRPGPTPGWGTFTPLGIRLGYFNSSMGIMTKKRKTPRKRGPKEERLVITEDPAVALQRLLKAPPTRKK